MKTTTIQEIMQQSGVVFGTSGARGLVTQMTDEVCEAYASAFIAVMAGSFRFNRVALGIDLRPSSPRIAAACVRAIRAAGHDVAYCGALPTPALALYSQNERIPAIMITGSHIPFDRNGIKFYRPDGEITKADEAAMAAARVNFRDTAVPSPGPFPELPPVDPGALDAYEARYTRFFPSNMLGGMRLGLYEHSSVARDALSHILQKLGAEVVSLGRTDIFVPIDTEAVSAEDMARGRAWSAEHKFDAILSTDGDGDRPLIGDENGHWMRGDIVGLLCARYLGVQSLAVPVSCNTAIEKCGAFARVIRTRIGSPYVIAGMHQFDAHAAPIAGFEANGGFLLGSAVARAGRTLEPLPTRDAVLPALAVLAAAREAGVPLSGLLSALPERHTASDRLQNFPVADSRRLIETWAADTAAFAAFMGNTYGEPQSTDITDGLRITYSDQSIIHLRPSGNAPELRCYAEAATPQAAAAMAQAVLAKIAQAARK
jgi:phosphomannomutase